MKNLEATLKLLTEIILLFFRMTLSVIKHLLSFTARKLVDAPIQKPLQPMTPSEQHTPQTTRKQTQPEPKPQGALEGTSKTVYIPRPEPTREERGHSLNASLYTIEVSKPDGKTYIIDQLQVASFTPNSPWVPKRPEKPFDYSSLWKKKPQAIRLDDTKAPTPTTVTDPFVIAPMLAEGFAPGASMPEIEPDETMWIALSGKLVPLSEFSHP